MVIMESQNANKTWRQETWSATVVIRKTCVTFQNSIYNHKHETSSGTRNKCILPLKLRRNGTNMLLLLNVFALDWSITLKGWVCDVVQFIFHCEVVQNSQTTKEFVQNDPWSEARCTNPAKFKAKHIYLNRTSVKLHKGCCFVLVENSGWSLLSVLASARPQYSNQRAEQQKHS